MFNIGDQVVIREDSMYYNKGASNPDNTIIGVILSIGEEEVDENDDDEIYPFTVKWSTGPYTNVYREKDLEFVEDLDIDDWV